MRYLILCRRIRTSSNQLCSSQVLTKLCSNMKRRGSILMDQYDHASERAEHQKHAAVGLVNKKEKYHHHLVSSLQVSPMLQKHLENTSISFQCRDVQRCGSVLHGKRALGYNAGDDKHSVFCNQTQDATRDMTLCCTLDVLEFNVSGVSILLTVSMHPASTAAWRLPLGRS